MYASVSISSGSKMAANSMSRDDSSWLHLTATDRNHAHFTLTFLSIDDAERAAHAILDAVASARPATARQGLVVEDVV